MDTGHETACSSGPSGQNQRAETVSLLSFVQDQEKVKADPRCKPAVSIFNTALPQQASPVGVYSAQLCMLHVQAANKGPAPQCSSTVMTTVPFGIVGI